MEYQLAAEMNPDSGEIAEELQGDAESAAREGRGQSRRQDRARSAGRADARPADAGPRSARRAAARFADLPKAPATIVIRALAQMANVNVVFDPAFQPTPITIDAAQPDVRTGAEVDHRQHADLFPRDGAADDHDHPGHARETPRIRRGNRPHVLSEQRRFQRDDGPAAHRDRRAKHRRRSPAPMRSRSRHARADRRRRAG